MKPVQLITTALGVVTVIAGAVVTVEARYASAPFAEEIANRLDRKILNDDLREFKKRLWDLQRKYGKDCVSKVPECRDLQDDIDKLARELSRKS